MARRHRAEKKPPEPDVRYNSTLVSYIIRTVMKRGKRSVAEGIVYGAMDLMQDKMGQDALEILKQAIDNIKPKLEVKSRRVGGATYQVPMEVSPERQIALAVRWITQYANGRRSVPMREALAYELMDAYNNQGSAVKKRDDTHKMAHANKAFAHYRW